MSTFERCPICHEYDFVRSHKCAPVYLVWRGDDFTDAPTRMHARDARDAAEKYASERDAFDAEFRSERTVVVKAPDGTLSAWKVEGEMVANYSAHRATEFVLPLSMPDPDAEDSEPEEAEGE